MLISFKGFETLLRAIVNYSSLNTRQDAADYLGPQVADVFNAAVVVAREHQELQAENDKLKEEVERLKMFLPPSMTTDSDPNCRELSELFVRLNNLYREKSRPLSGEGSVIDSLLRHDYIDEFPTSCLECLTIKALRKLAGYNRIKAIKIIRENTSSSLREAKEFLDARVPVEKPLKRFPLDPFGPGTQDDADKHGHEVSDLDETSDPSKVENGDDTRSEG